MRQPPTWYLPLFAATIIMALAAVPLAGATPIAPFWPKGSVTVNGQPVDAGVVIGARCSGVQVATTKTVLYGGASLYALEVPAPDGQAPGCIEGDTVTFTIDDVTALQTATWSSGANPTVNLTAEMTKVDSVTTVAIHDNDEVPVKFVAQWEVVHASAVVSGGASAAPAGVVDFTFYNDGACVGTGVPSGSVALSGSVAHPSDAQGPLAYGRYGFKARYRGDVNYNPSESPCVEVVAARSLFLPLIRR